MAMHDVIKETATVLICVEGKDDRTLIDKFLKTNNANPDKYDIKNVEGKDNFPTKIEDIKTLQNFENIEKFIIVRDADDSFDKAVKDVRKVLREQKLPVPGAHAAFTPADSDETLSVAFFIMPGENRTGMLETLCLDWFQKAYPPLWECLENYRKCIEPKLKTPIANIDKAKALMMLATARKSANSIEGAAQNDFFNFDSPIWQELSDFFKQAGLIT